MFFGRLCAVRPFSSLRVFWVLDCCGKSPQEVEQRWNCWNWCWAGGLRICYHVMLQQKKVQCSNELIVNWFSFLSASRPLLGSIVAGEGPREEESERDNVVAASASVDSVWYILQFRTIQWYGWSNYTLRVTLVSFLFLICTNFQLLCVGLFNAVRATFLQPWCESLEKSI